MTTFNADTVDRTKNTLIDLCIHYGPKVLTAFIILFVGIAVARRVSRILSAWLAKRDLEPPMQRLIGRMTYVAVFCLFLLMALQNLGVELLPLFASLGVAGVGVGLAMQGVLSNLSAGLTILFTRPFRQGEYVSLVGVEGVVESIDLFSTTLLHFDHSQVIIPNRKIVGEILHNYGKLRQLDLSVGLAYATDVDQALGIIREVLAENPHICKEPAAQVGVTYLDESSIRMSVKPWVKVSNYVNATGELYNAILKSFRKRGVEIPFPQREIRLLSPLGPSLS